MARYGLQPASLWVLVIAATLAVGSALVIADRALWLGTAVLAGFLLLTVPVAHPFWSSPAADRLLDLQLSLEHLSLCGGLLGCALASHLRQVGAV